MLRVLIILLCVLGGVMLLLALALLALLNIRARLEFVGVSGDMTLDAVYGPVRVPLWPRPRHLKRKKNRKEVKRSRKAKKNLPGADSPSRRAACRSGRSQTSCWTSSAT